MVVAVGCWTADGVAVRDDVVLDVVVVVDVDVDVDWSWSSTSIASVGEEPEGARLLLGAGAGTSPVLAASRCRAAVCREGG